MSRLRSCFHYRNALVGRIAKGSQRNSFGFLQFSGSRSIDEPKLTRSDEIQYHSVNQINVDKTPITAQLWSRRQKERESMVMSTDTELKGIASKPQETAPVLLMDKTAKESRLTIRYNFSQDANLRDLYVDSFGNVLIGKLFEDLDALAGNVAISHCDDNNPSTRPLSLVTARVDRIRQSKKISAADDLLLTGQIVWVGNSSLDVLMEIHKVKDIKGNTCAGGICDGSEDEGAILIKENVPSRLLSSLFTYVARDRRYQLKLFLYEFQVYS
jgi:acyl-CoA hydrolase